MKNYKVVHFMPKLKGGVFSTRGEAIESQLSDMINSHAAEGWQFVSYQTAHVAIAAGCLASLFGRKNEYAEYDILIFEKNSDA